MIKKIELPNELADPYIEYCEKVLSNPVFYTNPPYKNQCIDLDPSDPINPGITDEYILNADLTSNKWGIYKLETCLCLSADIISYPPVKHSIEMIKFLEQQVQAQILYPSGNFLYPKGGYMGWHTNSNVPGMRVYVTYSPIENGSYFKYVDVIDGVPTVITDWDNKGLTVRAFDVKQEPKYYFWHCVGSPNAPRISFGYLFK